MKKISLILVLFITVIIVYGNNNNSPTKAFNNSDSLVAFYPFNGNANDESGNGNNGTIHGATLTQDRFGNTDKAFQFNGTSDDITVLDHSSLQLTDELTLTAWVKRTRHGVDMILEKGGDWTGGTCNYGLSLHSIYNNMFYFFFNGGWRGTEGVLDFEWHHYAVVAKQGDANPLLYIDGILRPVQFSDGVSAINLTPSTEDLHIGSQLGTYPYYGANIVDEVRIYNRLLSPDEIFQMAQIDLVASYPFNGNAYDASGNLNHGVVNGAVLTTDRYGIADKAYYFDGGNSYIEGTNPGNNLPGGSQQRTISCWVQSTEAIGDKNIFHYGATEVAPTNYHLFLNLGNHAGIGNGYGYGTLISSTDIGDNTWHFIAGVYEGESTNLQHIFIDGKLDISAVISTTPNTVLSSNWKMGQFMSGSQSLLGKIDDLRVFNIALNNQDIMNLYLTETTAPVLQQPANQSTVTTLTPIMQWSSSLADAEFRIQLSADSLFTVILYDAVTNDLTIQLPEGILADGITYFWRVRTTLNGETGPWSQVWRFTFLNTGFEETLSTALSFILTPNPANISVKISYNVPESSKGLIPVSIEIVNSIGKISANPIIKNQAPGNYEFIVDTRMIEPGIYFCRLKGGENVLVHKLAIMH